MTFTLPKPADIPSQDELSLCDHDSAFAVIPRDVANIYLTKDGIVSVEIRTLIGGDMDSVDVAQGRTSSYDIPGDVDREALITALAPDGDIAILLRRVHDGSEICWNGYYHTCRLDADAVSASAEIDDALENLPRAGLHAWSAQEWLGSASSREILDLYGLAEGASDSDIDACAHRLIDVARRDDIVIRGGAKAIAVELRWAIAEVAAATSSDDEERSFVPR